MKIFLETLKELIAIIIIYNVVNLFAPSYSIILTGLALILLSVCHDKYKLKKYLKEVEKNVKRDN